MDLATFNWLLTDAGQALLAEAMAADLSAGARLQELERLRRRTTPERAAAAYEIAVLRQRAAAKFARASAMYFTREALEQASGEIIAAYRSERYRTCAQIADLACGIGGDALALAHVGHVTAVDRDPLRLAMAAANARACGVAERITLLQADLERELPPRVDALFFDPARRRGARRVFALDAYSPPVTLVRRWRQATPAIGVKVAPGVGDDELATLGDLEAEFISLDGELKEAVLWFGSLASPGRRATLLLSKPPTAIPPDAAYRAAHCLSLHSALGPSQPPALSAPARYLYEPDPSIIRAHLVDVLAAHLDAAQLDRAIAYLTGDRLVATPLARCWRVIEWLPFNLKRLRARLRALDVGKVTVKKRGSPLDTDALARHLSGAGLRPLVVVLTRVEDRPAALICEGPLNPAMDDGQADAAYNVTQ
jgi:predicted RNA methylase